MATNFRRTKLERFVRQLEAEISDLELLQKGYEMKGEGLVYLGKIDAHRLIVARLKREFELDKMKEEQK